MGKTVETLKRINKRKLRDELLSIGIVLSGVIWFICGIKKIVPGTDDFFSLFLTSIISLGYLGGLPWIAMGVCAFFEIRKKKYPHKRRHRK